MRESKRNKFCYEKQKMFFLLGSLVFEVPFPILPVAAFTASPVSGKAPLPVKFTDKSTGSPTSWSWNFGDKTTSKIQSPKHKYTKAGKYTVS